MQVKDHALTISVGLGKDRHLRKGAKRKGLKVQASQNHRDHTKCFYKKIDEFHYNLDMSMVPSNVILGFIEKVKNFLNFKLPINASFN